jgi:hypothetical protein
MISKLKDRTRLRNRTTAQTQTLAAMPLDTLDNEEHNDITVYSIS